MTRENKLSQSQWPEMVSAKPPIMEELGAAILVAFQVPKPCVPHFLPFSLSFPLLYCTFNITKLKAFGSHGLETREND